MRHERNLLWFGAALLLSGCVERPTETPRTEAVPGPAAFEAAIRANLLTGPLDHDRLFRAAAQLEPWFGGLYVEDGGLRVLATDLAVAGSRVTQVTEGLLLAAGRADLAIRAGTAQLVEARYSFRQLDEWLSILLPVVHRFEVHRVVIDERMNRIDLRTESAADAEALSQWAEEQGVPPSALVVRAAARAEFDYGIGGNGIVVRWGPGGQAAPCTLAQVVTRRNPDGSPHPTRYGITNSHCTSDMGTSATNTFEVSGGTPVALEFRTHPFISNSLCEQLTQSSTPMCRYADASLFVYGSNATGLLPHRVHLGWFSIPELDGEDIVFVGETVNKFGNVTKLTYGPVLQTCAHIQARGHASEQEPWWLCQYTADYHSDEGDSGGPVWVKETVSGVVFRSFVGIHWGHDVGHPEDPPGAYFSGVFHIAQEIVPSDPDFGTICLSANSMFCVY